MKLFGWQNYLKNFWNWFINIGVNEKVSADESRYVKFTNIVTLITAAAVSFYVPYSLFKNQYLLAALQFVDTLCVISVIWFNYKGRHKLARQAYLFVINFFVLINACFIGFASHAHDFFYISYVVPFLLFRVKDFKNIFVGVFMAVLFFIIYQL